MDAANKLLELLKDLSQELPSLITILICLVVALVRWKSHPRVSLVTSGALLLLLLNAFLFAALYTWVPDAVIESAAPDARESAAMTIYTILGLANNATLGLAFALLLVAIFMQRPQPLREQS